MHTYVRMLVFLAQNPAKFIYMYIRMYVGHNFASSSHLLSPCFYKLCTVANFNHYRKIEITIPYNYGDNHDNAAYHCDIRRLTIVAQY